MKQYSLALQMLDEMLWRDASIKRSTFNIVMSLFHRMVRLQPPPSVVDFMKFWSGVIKIKQYSVALHLFHHMLRMDAPVDGYSLNIAINCFCCVKRPDFGFAVLGSFFKRGYEPNVVTFTTLLKGLMLVGKIQEAAKLLGKLLAEQVCYPNEVTYHTIINGLCKAGHTLDALDLLGSFEKGSCKPNELCQWSSTWNPSNSVNMAASSSRSGIKLLLAAERGAQQIVNTARTAKQARLKQAKEEAEKELAEFRAQIEADFQRQILESSGDSGANVKRLEQETEAKIDHLKKEASRISPDVASMLLRHVTTVKN